MAVTSKTDIVNKALVGIGDAQITDLDTDTAEAAVKARAIYDEVRDNLMASHQWKFASKRTRLTAAGILVCTAKTIAFNNANPDTITDSGSGFVTAGWVAGDSVIITGSSSNNTTYDIDTVVAGTLTLNKNEEVTTESLVNSATLKLFLSPSHAYNYKYSKPSGCLKVISINDYVSDALSEPYWEEEGAYIITSERDERDQIDVVYINQVTDVTLYPIEFTSALVAELKAALSFPITTNRGSSADFRNESEVFINRAYENNMMRDNKNRGRKPSRWTNAGR